MAEIRFSSICWLASTALAMTLGCGRASRDALETNGVAGSAGALASGGRATTVGDGGARATTTMGTGGALDFAVALDAPDCAARPLSDCQNVDTEYESNGTFERTPALAPCGMFNSYDGCGTLVFAFDAEGCAISVSPGPSGWKDSRHLADLQECLTDAFAAARYPCLASGTLTYRESCFIRSP